MHISTGVVIVATDCLIVATPRELKTRRVRHSNGMRASLRSYCFSRMFVEHVLSIEDERPVVVIDNPSPGPGCTSTVLAPDGPAQDRDITCRRSSPACRPDG